MNQPAPQWQDDAEAHPVREYITYILGGMITLGLIGWVLGMVLHHGWIVFLGLGLGAASGAYIAWRHHVDRVRNSSDSNKS